MTREVAEKQPKSYSYGRFAPSVTDKAIKYGLVVNLFSCPQMGRPVRQRTVFRCRLTLFGYGWMLGHFPSRGLRSPRDLLALERALSALNSFLNLEIYGGQGRNRTADASLFRAALYRLSYLAISGGLHTYVHLRWDR